VKDILTNVQIMRDMAGGLFLLAFVALTAYMVVADIAGNEQMTGALVAVATMIAKRWFDGSPSSDRKTELLAQAAPVQEHNRG
jgi:hypothetical protein